ncbi:MAG: hypothetical protein M1822_006533 [Bathelium mastoideum]|nr:MAG: hypothetical protein M1822_006533 [Bathelium mastoideum]
MVSDPRAHLETTGAALGSNGKPKRSSIIRRLLDSKEILPMIKFTLIVSIAVAICALGLLSPKDILRSKRQFKAWYSQYAYQFRTIAQNNCTDEYSVYLYGTRKNTTIITLSGSGHFTPFIQPMLNCLLENASEYIKYQLSSSQVMLGLTPTIIALLGTSSEEVCFLALIGRRRLLGFLLAAASPSIYTERAFKYQEPIEILKERLHKSRHEEHVIPTMSRNLRWIVVLIEYTAILSAIANIGTLEWQLGVKSIQAVNPNTIFVPMLWSFLGVAAHLAGAVVFNMRARRLSERKNPPPLPTLGSSLKSLKIRNPVSVISKIPAACKNMVVREFCLDDDGQNQKLYFHLYPESRCFTFLAWFTSVLIVFHIILGTLILSSTNFVGPKDALGIMARFILSVIICRVILVYELAVLRVEHRNAEISDSPGHTSYSEDDREREVSRSTTAVPLMRMEPDSKTYDTIEELGPE